MKIADIFCVDPVSGRVTDETYISRVVYDLKAYESIWKVRFDTFEDYLKTQVFFPFILDLNRHGQVITVSDTLRIIARRVASKFAIDDAMPLVRLVELHANGIGRFGEMALVAPIPGTAHEFFSSWMEFVTLPKSYQAGVGFQHHNDDPYLKLRGLYDPLQLVGFREAWTPLKSVIDGWNQHSL